MMPAAAAAVPAAAAASTAGADAASVAGASATVSTRRRGASARRRRVQTCEISTNTDPVSISAVGPSLRCAAFRAPARGSGAMVGNGFLTCVRLHDLQIRARHAGVASAVHSGWLRTATRRGHASAAFVVRDGAVRPVCSFIGGSVGYPAAGSGTLTRRPACSDRPTDGVCVRSSRCSWGWWGLWQRLQCHEQPWQRVAV